MTDVTADVARSHKAPHQMPTNVKRRKGSTRTDKGLIDEARRYIKDPSEAPKGLQAEQGERGGWYYETADRGFAEEPQPEQKFQQFPLNSYNPEAFGADKLIQVNDALLDGLPDPPGQFSGETYVRNPTAYGVAGQQIQDEVELQRARALADRMQLPLPEPDEIDIELAGQMREVYGSDPEWTPEQWLQERMAKRRVQQVGSWIDAWTWSASEDRQGRAIQQAIAEEFGITDAAQPWQGMRAERGGPEEQARRYQELEAATAELYQDKGPFLRKLARAMYDETQEFFQTHGIEEVPVMRGMGLGDNEGNPLPLDPSAPGEMPGTDAEIDLMPGSCFTTNFDVAETFAVTVDHGATVFAKVPANRVLSTWRTGFGQMKEAEIVVLGGPLQGVVVPAKGREQVMPGQHYTKDNSDALQWAKYARLDPADLKRVVKP